ncbi:hypothetical protein BLA29_013213 [Euroglyphus maynei]|uniref:Uncharacterized protein n=1 Tax=Euroglyphus maynei TaxID=6958 RepID=A0A1Y3ANP8_EURMA|nr:hypothetical protein BLA29_013213 [Euroglyphus maynei]
MFNSNVQAHILRRYHMAVITVARF